MNYGIALAGGGTRGAAHVGVLLALEEQGLCPSYIAGTSAGGIVAGLYAAGCSAKQMKEIVGDLSKHWRRLIDPNYSGLLKAVCSLFCLGCTTGLSGLIKGNRLERYFHELVGEKRMCDCRIPTVIPAVDLNTGNTIAYVHTRSPLLHLADVQWNREALLDEAMRATSAYPVVFQPKPMGNQYLVDGGISDNLPVNLLMASGITQVLAVDLSSPYQPPKKKDLIEIASHSLTIMQSRLQDCTTRGERLSLNPQLPDDAGLLTFDQMIPCMEAGYRAAQEAIPAIKAAFGPSSFRKGQRR